MAVELTSRDSVLPPTNLAGTAKPSASSFSTIGPHFTPASAIDGKLYTRWNSAAWTKSNGNEQQWFQLEWNTAQELSQVRIVWGESFAVSYTLAVSLDGISWKQIQEATDGKGGTETISLQHVQARYLRLASKRGTKGISAYSIREIGVY